MSIRRPFNPQLFHGPSLQIVDGIYLIPEPRMALSTTVMILSVNTFKAPFDGLTPSLAARRVTYASRGPGI
jgi:hypothetical protein